MRALTAAALLAGCVLLPAAAAPDRIDFKGLQFGATEADVKKAGAAWCRPDRVGQADRTCMWEDPRLRTYAGHFARVMEFEFLGKRLDSVSMEFSPQAFDPIREAIDAKYGAGQCRPGYEATCVWIVNGDSATLMLRDLTTYLQIGSREGKAERKARIERALSRAKKDI